MHNSFDTKHSANKLIEVELPADQLEIGMYVKSLDRPWLDTPFMFQGFRIASSTELQQLKDLCQTVTIEVEENYWFSYQKKHVGKASSKKQSRVIPEPTVPLTQSMPEAKKLHDQANTEIHEILERVKNREDINIEPIRETVNGFVKSVVGNPNALLWLTRIKDRDEYTAEHCLRVGIMAIAFGRHLGLAEDELTLLGMCGMLHDVGKMAIPDEILNKPGRLTKEEFETMKSHADKGGQMLEEQSGLDDAVIFTARHHHERLDGNGYPAGLKAEYISLYTRIISIVDAYDAISSIRCYKSAMTPAEALKILFDNRGHQFDADLVQDFILMVGAVPTGSIVEMTSGEIGIVLSINHGYKNKPKVLLVRNQFKKQQQERIINLVKCPVNDEGVPYEIAQTLKNGEFGVDILDYCKPKEYPHLNQFDWL